MNKIVILSEIKIEWNKSNYNNIIIISEMNTIVTIRGIKLSKQST